MEMCVGVCIVGVGAFVLARVWLCAVQALLWMSLVPTAVLAHRKWVSARVGGVQPSCNVTLAGTSLLIGNGFTYLYVI